MMSLAIYGIPPIIYALVVKLKYGTGGREIVRRLGLTLGERRYYSWALAFALAGIVLIIGSLQLIQQT